jgi:hypothetical protein
MRVMNFVVFLGVLSLLLIVVHFYLFTRVAHYLSLADGPRKALALFLGAMFLLTIGGMTQIRSLPRELASPLAWVVFTWMGVIGFSFISMITTDIVYVFSLTRASAATLDDPERRAALQRIFGMAALGATAVLSGYSTWNALRTIEVKPLSIALKRLPAAANGLCIAQLTDLHLGPTIDGKWLAQVVEKTNALNPDIIAITGDLVDGSVEHLGSFAAHLKDLRAKYGVYFVTGNHEYYSGVEEWVVYLRSLGIRVLRNERIALDLNGVRVDLAGVEDYGARHFPGEGPDLPKALAGRDSNVPVILLAHQPIAIKEAALHGVDLQLSGHTHGGQIWPWTYLVYLQQPYIAGLHRHPGSDTQIYVSSGTGYWGPPMRLGTSAEITRITLSSVA